MRAVHSDATVMTRPSWVAGLAEAALDRLTDKRNQLAATADDEATRLRVAELWDRTARWWNVLFHHSRHRLCWMAALGAYHDAQHNADMWRELAEMAGARDVDGH